MSSFLKDLTCFSTNEKPNDYKSIVINELMFKRIDHRQKEEPVLINDIPLYPFTSCQAEINNSVIITKSDAV